MKIAMIGAGRMGQALAGLFAAAGHEVLLSNSRGPESLADLVHSLGPHCSAATVADAVHASDVVFLATPWGKTAAAAAAVNDWSGRIVVDTTNNRSAPGPDGLIDIGDRVSSEIVAEYVPGARLVKAFNTTPIPIMVAALGAEAGKNNAVYLAGDDADAKALVTELVASINGVAVDTGNLRTGGYRQGMSGPLAGSMEMLTPAEAFDRLALVTSNHSEPEIDPEKASDEMAIVRVSKSTNLPVSADEVWAFLGDFGGYASWQPHIESVQLQPDGTRKVNFTRGDSVFDRIARRDDEAKTLTYELVPGQETPLKSLAATFSVREDGAGSDVEYTIEVEVPDEMQDLARAGIGADIDGALGGLDSKYGG